MERGALIRTRRTLDGAVKWAFRHLRRELDTLGLYFILIVGLLLNFRVIKKRNGQQRRGDYIYDHKGGRKGF